jgi:hypothetical protein
VNLPALGADYLHKDIFVEMDYMARASATNGLAPSAAVINGIVAAFANAPVSNPDGIDGINIHLDLNNQVTWDNDLNPVDSQFYALKASNFNPNRTAVYHYMIWADNYNGNTSSGLSFGIPATDFIVTLGGWNGGAGGTNNEKIGTFIHELGHNLALTHGGSDHVNYKPNYLSVMNYWFQTVGVYRNGSWGNFDYQRITTSVLNENSLSEALGLNTAAASAYGTRYYCPGGASWAQVTVTAPMDWNCDGDTLDSGLSIDVNFDGSKTTLTAQNNWPAVVYSGGGVIGSGLSPADLSARARENAVDVHIQELTWEMEQEFDLLRRTR